MLVVSSVAGVFHSVISSFMLLIILGFYVLLKYAVLLSWEQAKTQQPIGTLSPVITTEYIQRAWFEQINFYQNKEQK